MVLNWAIKKWHPILFSAFFGSASLQLHFNIYRVSCHIMTVCVTGLQRKANWNIRLWNSKLIHSQRFVRKASVSASCTINTLASLSLWTSLKWERRAGARCWLLSSPHHGDVLVRYKCRGVRSNVKGQIQGQPIISNAELQSLQVQARTVGPACATYGKERRQQHHLR